MHPLASRLASAWKGTAFEGKAYFVGGIVRDTLLGKPAPSDVDIVVEGDALSAAQLLFDSGLAAKQPELFPRFGTAMVTVDGLQVEIASARKESYSPSSRKPDVEPATLLEDALRRDFTVNALLQRIDDNACLDLLETGLEDLKSKTLRTPVDPARTFYDDPLRMLRAVRFKWQLGFNFAEGLAKAVRDQSPRLQVISAERIREEFEKILVLEEADKAMQDLLDTGLLTQFAPEFLPMVECQQGHYHHLDVWQHTLLALRNTRDDDLVLRLGVLLHDIGKPATQTTDEQGRIRFFNHENVGADMAETILRRLKFSHETCRAVAVLVRNHMRLNSMNAMSASAARRIVRDLGEHLEQWLLLIEADASALRPGVKSLDVDAVRSTIHDVLSKTPAATLTSPLNGREIQKLTGLVPGPQVGSLKRMLLEDVLDGSLSVEDKSAASVRLMEHWRNVQFSNRVAQDNMESSDRGE